MNTLAKLLIFFIVSQTTMFAQNNAEYSVTITVENLNSNDGHVYMSLYDSESTFLGKGYKSAMSTIENKTCVITFKDVPSGVYAVSFFHDENENKKMDSNFLGIPKEDYGCSNNAKGFMGPPKWEDAKFEIKNGNITQTITL